MVSFGTWVKAARLRTLPLSFSCIILGSLLAKFQGSWDVWILILALLTTLFYQVLSNYANDYGDGVKGTDADRKGEARAVASGLITHSQMKKTVVLFAILSFVSGTILSWYALGSEPILASLFTFLGVFAIVSAIRYTVGSKAYGYKGMGDLYVLLFFGWVGVIGSNFLFTHSFDWSLFLPASSIGLLAVGVLNLNNLRDVEGDIQSGKNTIPARFGRPFGKVYQGVVVLLAVLLSIAYTYAHANNGWAYLFLLVLPIQTMVVVKSFKAQEAEKFDPLLKPLAISTAFFALLMGIGFNL